MFLKMLLILDSLEVYIRAKKTSCKIASSASKSSLKFEMKFVQEVPIVSDANVDVLNFRINKNVSLLVYCNLSDTNCSLSTVSGYKGTKMTFIETSFGIFTRHVPSSENIELTKTATKYKMRLELDDRLYSHPYLEQNDFVSHLSFISSTTTKAKPENGFAKVWKILCMS